MPISKVHPMENPIIKIGILGPKPFGMMGHDSDNSYRMLIKGKIDKILQDFINEYTVVGMTGLNLGVEQDFAEVCISNNIEYITYLSYEDQEKYWINLSNELTKVYQYYLDKSLNVISLDDGKFSPKKVLLKTKKIINESDCIIYVKHSQISQINDITIKYLSSIDKSVFII